VFVVVPQDPHLDGGLIRRVRGTGGAGWRVVAGQQGVSAGGEIELACAEVAGLAADGFGGGAHQVFDLVWGEVAGDHDGLSSWFTK